MSGPTQDVGQMLRSIEQARIGGRFREALDQLLLLPPEIRAEFQVLAREADLYGQLGDHEREIALYNELIGGWRDIASLWAAKANALKTVGRTAEAIEAARQAIALQPSYGKAWWVLAELKSRVFSDEDVATMERLLDAGPADADQLHLHFALGRALEDRGRPAEAFAHYAAGNAMRAASIPAGATAVTRRVERQIERFSADFFADREGSGFRTGAPIFIVGLPRSGTTLIEQILASHPEVEATAELEIISQLQSEIVADPNLAGERLLNRIAALEAPQLEALGRAYVERASDFRRTDRPRFIDKLPSNWINLGFIRLILPDAKIIDARRHPMAVGFSNFRQHYALGVHWSYSLDGIGQYYRDYLRLMGHFDHVLPGWIHRVIHEQLVEDFEPEVRRLLAHLGLEFDPACLEFHRSGRPVRSASAEQVRRPINREGLDQWRQFEPWLGPLKQALGPALEDWQ